MHASRFFILRVAVVALGFFAASSGRAEVVVASPFTDHAVLQRNLPVPIWGHGAAGEKVTVNFHYQTLATTADAHGRWSVRLKPMSADASGADLSITGQNSITLHDIVVGEVWLASGQSNMEWPLHLARDAKAEIASATLPLVRHLKIEHTPSDTPSNSVKTSGWQVASPETAGSFTAVGYFFAHELSAKINVPVGIIHSSWGGTPIESWLDQSVLKSTKGWPRFEAEWTEALRVFPRKKTEYAALDRAWQKADEASRMSGKPNPLPWPHPPVGPGTAYAPGGLFNGMIVPLIPYAVRGALWYQGESNVGRATEYAELFPAMIRDWRESWGQGDFAFLFVQLPNYADNHPTGTNWAELRDAQNAALKLPQVGEAVTIDVGEADNLHPTNKKPVGERLALLAEAKVYKMADVEGVSPQFVSAKREAGTIRVTLAPAKGLVVRGLTNSSTGFDLAGADHVFHPANATVENETVVVSSPEVKEPVAVRYAFTNNPSVTLYNDAGLPAGPFRSDDW